MGVPIWIKRGSFRTMMVMNPGIHYSDKNSKKMIRRRRLQVAATFVGFLTLSSLYVVLNVMVLEHSEDFSFIARVEILIFATFGILAFTTALFFVLPWRFMKELAFGIELTEESLRVFGDEIPTSRILRIEIADFGSGSHFLAVGYLDESSRQRKLRTLLVWPKDTKDIWQLCNNIRLLRGWPPQKNVRDYGWFGWGRWKRSLRNMGLGRQG